MSVTKNTQDSQKSLKMQELLDKNSAQSILELAKALNDLLTV